MKSSVIILLSAVALCGLVIAYTNFQNYRKYVSELENKNKLLTETLATQESKEKEIKKKNMKAYDSNILLELINEARAINKLPKLNVDNGLCEITDSRLNDMHLDFSHELFVETVRKFQEENPKYQDYDFGENLSAYSRYDYGNNYDERLITLSFLASTTHRDNIMEKNYTSTCIRCDATNCVQIFAGL